LNGVYKSIDSGESWIPASAGLPENLGVTALAAAPSDSNILYLAASYKPGIGVALYKKHRWRSKLGSIATGSAASAFNGLAVDPTTPNIV
jgi:hypothetical protein